MRQKLITLCPTTFEKATKMHNFSAWVRKKLLEEGDDDFEEEKFVYHYQCPMCKEIIIESIRYARTCQKCNWPMDFQGKLVA